ncbi:tyrosine-type recombinase/integrase [Paraburkholderia sp. Ac-20340]|uniref:tyrosine-type recombinase/integrase n=1 Tax=Paraburkholderia sp. Ac-20340 TaxID=2703888 RepID=UPI00197F3AA7|nr:tyrosine-type recombinase/integrase [Paraburkholderia sp. Ac-20340]MBN3851947.1 tyrosine-type recombinase/integrase [Paraburkholderia sp. Ac-20340]
MAARRRIAARRNWPDNLYKNTKGYYWFRNPGNGKTIGLGYDFREASSQARTANAELERRKGHVDILQKLDIGVVSLASWCDTYFETKKDGNRNTVNALKSHIKAIKEDPFSAQPIASITPMEVSTFIDKTAKDRGVPTAKLIRGKLLDIFRKAIAKGLVKLGENPVEPIEKPVHEVARQRLTLDDFLKIRSLAEKQPEYRWFVNAMNLALITGQRREEIASMRFEQIKDGYLWVEQQKTGAKLMIPLTIHMKALEMTIDDVIKACRDSVVSRSPIHYLKRSAKRKPGDAVSMASLSYAFKKFRDELDPQIPLEEGKTPSTFHEIRSLSARLYTKQYDEPFSQAILGHKSASSTALYRDSRGREWSEVKIHAA